MFFVAYETVGFLCICFDRYKRNSQKIKEHPRTTKRKRKRFIPEFKAEVVIEAHSIESSEAEICRRHNITEAQLSQWKRQFVENVATLFEPNPKQPDTSTERIAQLEQLVGKLTQAVDIEKKALRGNTQAKTLDCVEPV